MMQRRSRLRRTTGVITALLALTATFIPRVALAADGNLPAGTSISVTVDDPADGTELLIPTFDVSRDVDVSGTASVGQGVPLKNTTVVYVVDVSGSMGVDSGVNCDGVAGTDSRLTCAKAAVAAANTAAADPFSAVGLTGIASFGSAGAAHDVDLGTGGTQLLVAPTHDGNSNGTPDVEDVANGLTTAGQTNLAAGLSEAITILNDPSNTSAFNLVLYLSDADSNSAFVGPNVSTLAGSVPPNTTIRSFGIGSGPSCGFDGGTGSLDDVAALSTTGTGTCAVINDIGDLADAIVQSLGSSLDSLDLEVDGGGTSPIPNSGITPNLPQTGPAAVTYLTTAPGLVPGEHLICVTANGTDAGGTGDVTECVTVYLLKITLAPDAATNELGTPGQTHTVTATILGPATGPGSVAGRLVSFDITAGPNAGDSGTGTTDAAGETTFTYAAQQGPSGLGTDVIQACFTLRDPAGETGCDRVTKTWVDTTPPQVGCPPTTNPHGHQVPPATNEDGFFELTASDAVDPNPDIFVVDTGTGTVFGPFPSGTRIKYTQAPGATPSIKKMGSTNGQAGAVQWHIKGQGDAAVYAVDDSGNQSSATSCLVPPPPK
jgi:hypothetical protein